MKRPAPTLCALAVVLLMAAGCGGRSRTPAYEVPPLAPPGEDKPSDEVSQNLALALGAAPNGPAPLEQQRGKLPKELVGDQQNADYSGERLTGSAATSVPAPNIAAAPLAAPRVIPAVPAAPKPAPRVAVERQPTSPAQVPAAPKTAAAPASPPPPAPAAPKAPVSAAPAPPAAPSVAVASAATAGQVIAQIAAFRTRANAEGGWQRLRAAYPDLLGDRALILHEVDLGTRGIYYRVRTGPFADTAEAKAFCERLRVRDQACLVVNPK